jgi:hydrophobic/amphiphilic exporter-1 (mainly G- bacteria), HAE1 family
MNLTRYAIYRRLACGAIAALLVVLGLYALSLLPMNYLPSITYPLIKVEIRWDGAAPTEIEKNIAQPVERVIATVDRLERMESSSFEGRYSLDLHFKYGADVDVAFQDVTAALARVRNLPATVAPPYAFKADPTQIPVMQLAISSDRWDPVTLRDWSENWFLDRLMAVPGVAGTDIVGAWCARFRSCWIRQPSKSTSWYLMTSLPRSRPKILS